jgi:hypothetical protein
LLDHLVGTGKHGDWDVEVERFGGLGVDDELELGRLKRRRIGRFFALENSAGVDSDLAIADSMLARAVIESVIQLPVGRRLQREHSRWAITHSEIGVLIDAIGQLQYLPPGQYEQRGRLLESPARPGCFSREQ